MKIYVVGLGPGGRDDMTLRAVRAIEQAQVVVGYTYYIELISDMLADKEVFTSSMTKETERCKKALEYALGGKTVAMVSSGDAGVYGMAGLMYEVCKEHPEIEIEVAPGVTAACSGGAVVGAPLTHDFAVISLSDRLTPWEVIEKRIRAASAADFAICIYNPSSTKRAGYLEAACGYMLEYKSPDTPCACVENIGRKGERYAIYRLGELGGVMTNMFTTVFVGNSETKIINGRMITPRGYKGI